MRWYWPTMGLAVAHLVLAIVCVVWLRRETSPIDGVHPALKPLKFSISVALLLASVAMVLRGIDTSSALKAAIAWTLCVTMVVEMIAIVGQAARGRSSHFNVGSPTDAMIWHVMGAAIVVATMALIALAVIATTNTLAFDPLIAAAVRIGLWSLLLVAVSGVAMGARGSHDVGLAAIERLPVTQWNRTAGDLRVPHFFAVHALQVLPLCAMALLRLPLAVTTRWIALGVIALGWTALSLGTLFQAMIGRPLL